MESFKKVILVQEDDDLLKDSAPSILMSELREGIVSTTKATASASSRVPTWQSARKRKDHPC